MLYTGALTVLPLQHLNEILRDGNVRARVTEGLPARNVALESPFSPVLRFKESWTRVARQTITCLADVAIKICHVTLHLSTSSILHCFFFLWANFL